MLFSIVSLALAATAIAFPTLETTAIAPPPTSKEFYVQFSVLDGNQTVYLAASAVANNTKGAPANSLVIIGQRPSLGVGTPAYFNGTSPNAAFNFDLTSSSTAGLRGVYGAIVPLVGDDYGYAGDVLAVKNQQDFKWSQYNGTIGHQPQAALNSFYACYTTLNGKPVTVLKWGTPQNTPKGLFPPTGCQTTNIIKNPHNKPSGY